MLRLTTMFALLSLVSACATGALTLDPEAAGRVEATVDAEEVAYTEGLIVHSPTWVEAVPDAFPGGNLQITLENLGPEDFMWYPGVTLTASHPDVTGVGVYQLYGIAADQQVLTGWNIETWQVRAPAEIVFTAEVSALGCPSEAPDASCPPPRPIRFTLEVE